MQFVTNKPTLNAAQISLLQIFNKYKVTDEELMEIRTLLANFFLSKTLSKTDSQWENNVANEDTIDKLIRGK